MSEELDTISTDCSENFEDLYRLVVPTTCSEELVFGCVLVFFSFCFPRKIRYKLLSEWVK